MKERDYATNANVFRHDSLRCDEEWIIARLRQATYEWRTILECVECSLGRIIYIKNILNCLTVAPKCIFMICVSKERLPKFMVAEYFCH